MFAQVLTGTATNAEALRRQVDRWNDEIRPGAAGFLGSTGGVTADGKFVALITFASEAEAQANSQRAEQGAWWAETEQHLENVQFMDSTDVTMMQDGASNDAGFVQVMRGRVLDEAAYALMMEKMLEFEDSMKAVRPDVLGGVTVRCGDNDYFDFIYFQSEAAAREGEAAEMPADLMAQFEQMMSATEVDEFLDLSDPWLR